MGRCGSKGERLGYERSGFNPGWIVFSFFLMETLSITGPAKFVS